MYQKRDEKWKEMTIANTSALQFDQEFGNTFFGTGDTLIDGETLMGFRAKNPRKVREGGDLLIYREPIKDHQYIMTVDVCKGRGQDYSTFSVFDISTSLLNKSLYIAIILSLQFSFLILYISTQSSIMSVMSLLSPMTKVL